LPKKALTLPDTPAALGYRMPAEWEPHEATWIAWPHNRTDWPGKFEAIPWIYAEIVRYLAGVEQVNILVNDEAAEAKARQVLARSKVIPEKASEPGKKAGNVRFFQIPTNRVWTRDYGPIFVRRESRKSDLPSVAATTWRFNAWAKYSDWKLDAPAGTEIAQRLRVPSWQAHLKINTESYRVVLEGGSIDVNGRGTLITTEECLLSDVQQRNPGLSREHLEEIFADYLGIEKVIWLERGIAGFRWLKKSTDQDGRPLKIVKLPMPKPVYFEDQRLPASYANFYIANKLVLVPVFGDANDRVALNTLAELFPDREVIGIYCRDFIWGLGALHCMTQQQPAP
jgi:agmatine deiminase